MPPTGRARRIPVPPDLQWEGVPFDYGDAFEVRLDTGDTRSALDFARAALEGAHPMVRELIWRVHRHVLRLNQGPRTSPSHVLGWEVITSDKDRVEMAAESSLVRAVIIGRRLDPTTVSVATLLSHRKPIASRALWTMIGPVHRRIAPYLLEHAAGASQARFEWPGTRLRRGGCR